MTLLITGVTGNTGSLVLEKLLVEVSPKDIIGIVRNRDYNNPFGINLQFGDLNDTAFLKGVFDEHKIDEIIHIANIRFSLSLLDLAEKNGVSRIILIHTTGIYSKYQEYNNLYNLIENEVMSRNNSNTSFVILRPSMIYGNENDYNMHKLIKFIAKSPIFPLFGSGKSLMQPIHVGDLAQAIVDVFKRKEIRNDDFNITGASILEYRQIIRLISSKLDKSILLLKVPIPFAIIGAKLIKLIFRKTIITVEQIERLQEDKVYTHEKAKEVFQFQPRTFEEGIVNEIKILRSKGII